MTTACLSTRVNLWAISSSICSMLSRVKTETNRERQKNIWHHNKPLNALWTRCNFKIRGPVWPPFSLRLHICCLLTIFFIATEMLNATCNAFPNNNIRWRWITVYKVDWVESSWIVEFLKREQHAFYSCFPAFSLVCWSVAFNAHAETWGLSSNAPRCSTDSHASKVFYHLLLCGWI